MLGFAKHSALDRKRDKRKHRPSQEPDDQQNMEDAPPPSSKGNRSKRNSGMFDIGHTQSQGRMQEQTSGGAVQRRTSKRASSQDRHGQVYSDDVPGFRPETPDMGVDTALSQVSPRDAISSASPKRPDPTRYELPLREHKGGRDVNEAMKSARDNLSRPRTRTLEERIRSRSPQTSRTETRKRIGSMQSVSHLPLQEDLGQGGSIGYPSIISTSGQTSASTSLQRLVQTPPRPLSPAGGASAEAPVSHSHPVSDAERILSLMRSTGGRMHGILYFRLSKSSFWQSGYCAINIGTGGLIYQTKGELAQTKTLIPDLRGCKVRTQFDPESRSNFLEMSTRSSGLSIHLRPLVPETFDSWLAALLCWQPLKSTGSQHIASIQRQRPRRPLFAVSGSGNSTPNSSTMLERAASQATIRSKSSAEVYSSLRNAPIIKTTRILWWDLSAPQSAPAASPRRISTYRQQRMSAGAPWRKAITIMHSNGLLEIVLESTKDREGIERAGSLLAVLEMQKLAECAVQRLHPSVLDDEFCLAVYPRYKVKIDRGNDAGIEGEEESTSWPIYLSLESRVLLETWYALMRAFTVPELNGPGSHALNLKTGMTTDRPHGAEVSGDVFRVKRSLYLRVTEAQLHMPRPVDAVSSMSQSGKGSDWVSGDYHAEVQIDGEVRGRTALTTQTSTPFWRVDYQFDHLPPLASHASIVIKSRQVGQRDWTLISDDRYDPEDLKDADHLDLVEDIHISPLDSIYGTVELELNKMEYGLDTEKWWPICNEYGESVGTLFLKVHLDETIVLPHNEYSELHDLLHTFSNGLAMDVIHKCGDGASHIHETLLNIFQVSRKASSWITTMVEDEIDALQRDVSASRYRFSRRIASNDSYDSGVERELVLRDMGKSASTEANLLFRGNTPLTKALELHMRRLGKEYLESVLGEHMRDIDESEPECEVDPNKVQHPEALQRNWRNLILLTESIWRSIYTSANKCPAELRQIFRHIRACAEDRYGAFLRTISYSSVSAFLFLRLLVPAILNPSLFGLLKELPRQRSRRTLTMIAKSLQTLANMNTFGAKEAWMEPMNAFLNSHRQEFKDFIDDVCSISQERPRQPSQLHREYTPALQIFETLPPARREGFPSLPYLIDQPREFAILVNAWMDSRRQAGRIPVVSEDLARLDVLCNRLHTRTEEVLALVAAVEPTSVSGINWEQIIAHLNRKANANDPASGMTSPTPSTPPPDAKSHNTVRPQPLRSSTTGSMPNHRASSNGDHLSQPHSGGSLGGFAAAAAADAGAPLVSPSVISFTEARVEEGEVDSAQPTRPGSSSAGWESTDQEGSTQPRVASIGSAGTAGYIHPLAWNDPGSAGSNWSKASSLQSLDVDAANSSVLGNDERGLASSALPWSGAQGPMDSAAQGASPVASPRDPESQRRLMDVFAFRRRNQRDRSEKGKEREKEKEAEAKKKAQKKEAKREKEERKRDKEKDRVKDGREGSTVGADEGPSVRRGFSIVH